MKNKNRFIAILTALALCTAFCALTVSAADLDADGYDDDTGELIVATEAPAASTEAPQVVATTEAAQPVTYYEEETTAAAADDDYYYYYEETTAAVQDDYYYSYNNDTSTNSNNDSLYYSDNSEVYVGGNQQMYTVPSETAQEASLYDTDDDVDDDELSDSDWEEIAANLKNANNDDSDSDDFGFIKDNTSSGDNGDWMLIVGIVCLLLSAAGIAYTIISSVMNKKKFRRAFAGAPTGAGAKQPQKTPSNNGQRQKKLSRKYDTADVYLPKNSGGSNNSRYRYK